MLYTWSRELLLSTEPDKDLIDKLSPNLRTRHVYRWNNGRVGAIFPNEVGDILDFREYELYDGPCDNLKYPEGLRPVKEGDEDSNECKELLAAGIVAYYLHMRMKKNPKDIFADYLKSDKGLVPVILNQPLLTSPFRTQRVTPCVNMPSELHSRVAAFVASTGTTINDFINQAITNELKKVAAL